jgi:prepilin-type N-terminal cleavage/methylation domain-containing protein
MKNQNQAFSLLELLVVIAIVGIMSVLTTAGIDALRVRELTGAVLSCESLIAQTRQIALQSGGRARLLVSSSGSQSFQQMVVVREARDVSDALYSTNGGTPRFEAASPVFKLKDYFFFAADMSDFTNTMKFNAKSGAQQDGGTGDSWLYLEFGANGSLLDTSGRFILGKGIRDGDAVSIAPGAKNIDGFFVSRLGRPIVLQTPTASP